MACIVTWESIHLTVIHTIDSVVQISTSLLRTLFYRQAAYVGQVVGQRQAFIRVLATVRLIHHMPIPIIQ